MGGVMLASTEWAGGLRDRVLPVSAAQRASVEPELRKTIETVINSAFRLHGLGAPSGSAGILPAVSGPEKAAGRQDAGAPRPSGFAEPAIKKQQRKQHDHTT